MEDDATRAVIRDKLVVIDGNHLHRDGVQWCCGERDGEVDVLDLGRVQGPRRLVP